MSRSQRKTPVRGMCGSRHHVSEKDDKRRFNRKMRRTNKQILDNTADHDSLILKHKDEVEDIWGFKKDGKVRFNPKDPLWKKEMRK